MCMELMWYSIQRSCVPCVLYSLYTSNGRNRKSKGRMGYLHRGKSLVQDCTLHELPCIKGTADATYRDIVI